MITNLAVILPCQSLDDFPVHCHGDDAEGLLAACSALWHPALLAAVGKTPVWHYAGEPPPSLVGQLLVLPEVARSHLPHGYLEEARRQGAMLIENLTRRDEIVAAAIAALATGVVSATANADRNLAGDFLSLGFCYLQGELLTRRMRYSSHLDVGKFERASLAAAKSWTSGDVAEAQSQLGIAFNALLEARGQFYPVDAYLLDVILIAPTTIGQSLRDDLTWNAPQNVLISAETVECLARSEPESLAALRWPRKRQEWFVRRRFRRGRSTVNDT